MSTFTFSERPTLCVSALLCAWLLPSACGLLDGISGGGNASEEQVCDAFRDLAEFEAGCRGTAIAPDNNICQCLYSERSRCPQEWRDVESCLFDEPSCDEVDVDGVCGEPVAAFIACAALQEQCSGGAELCTNNGDCFDGDDPSCPDCQNPCDFNGHCDEFEDEGSCSDCTPCDNDTVCLVTEHPVTCGDCAGIPCVHDFVCTAVVSDAGDEIARCDDCVTLCGEGCGAEQACTDLNRRLCQEFGNDNCRFTEPETSVCHDRCDDDGASCGPGTTCALDVQSAQFVCERARCDDTTSCEDPDDICSGPVDLDLDLGVGFCLERCDPFACSFGDDTPGPCSCTAEDNAPFTRCAPVRDADTIADFACTVPGPSFSGQPCTREADCATNLFCFEGSCRALCNESGDSCAGTCSALTSDLNVCIDG